ncbi:anti-sigma F factor antagonist [Bacillota bacterium]
MEIRYEMKDDVLIPVLKGELDHHSAGEIRDNIDNTYKAFKAKHIVLSFDDLTFMDSSGIGLIMGRYKKVREEGGKIAIIGCNEYILRILELAGIYTIAQCYADLEEAMAAFNKGEEEGI